MITTYLETYQALSKDTSLVVFFRPEPAVRRLEDYHARFWAVLQHLHDTDTDPERWPAAVPRDPNHPMWEFSYGGTSIFVVCNTPAHLRRRSRYSPGFVITFQPRWVFEGPEPDSARGVPARRVIRKRLRAFDGTEPSLLLGNYGNPDNREWRQYFLPDKNTDAALACPFHAAGHARAPRPTSAVLSPVGARSAERRRALHCIALHCKMIAEAGLGERRTVTDNVGRIWFSAHRGLSGEWNAMAGTVV